MNIFTITIIPNDRHTPPGKLADAELHFTDDAGVFAGLKLIGFGIWERRDGGRNVTFPARSYAVNGERRSFALLRSTGDVSSQYALRDAILDAYRAYDEPATTPAPAPLSRGDVAATTGQYIATRQGPVDTRSAGTAAEYGSRGDAPATEDWRF